MTISKLLVANRGEIAARVLRTAKARGLATAVLRHTSEQKGPAHLIADEIVTIDGPTPVAAYLDIPQIVEAAKRIGADAVHPGYGFLSENAAFVAALEEAGVTFVGPTSQTIDLMGDKVRARAFVEERGFPVAPSAIEDDDPASFVERARAVGYPLLIKPSAGGGGKGMRVVREDCTLETEIETARREGERYFGDGRLFVERYIERPRHIEVQVMGDGQGNVVHFWERECSIQRRFQKIIEETPSPALTPEQRDEICETAAGIARAVKYRGAGTVEFIYAQDGAFYFLEMNTRLQVEHPVTEMVTGFDLVAEQLRIAAGEGLSTAQADIPQNGHSIELRICAEDATADFRPAIGDILLLDEPSGPGVRVDSGILSGGKVTTGFDPMLSKLIVHGADRPEAIARARQAVRNYVILGVTTNTGYLDAILAHPDFAAGNFSTSFLGEQAQTLTAPGEDVSHLLIAAAALSDERLVAEVMQIPEMHRKMGEWRN
ncbi:acetyl-CoA carboxylase biotin carboxylase subunit [Roseibium aggregatum]|jgi:propionyl-CoA carboxylase alpha chain/3-methylcrotonyl-CoA carboxylase alpha subunit/acetyl-CoA/propionyl-CoA carboxylase biotin carboxyl carrier protein|uniref:acetyl-CoA carboxylase biotin carboxylase subunit n=1 Tax=Roseibium aggregatum TaxID=187304 RepID=UPI001E422EBE|nr:biotin carboxylase N-terminal domain-containing protein [Roseibium aggregatum]UES54081.1 ATP-grasp domain-containing protein [Roseibium aggregatum]